MSSQGEKRSREEKLGNGICRRAKCKEFGGSRSKKSLWKGDASVTLLRCGKFGINGVRFSK